MPQLTIWQVVIGEGVLVEHVAQSCANFDGTSITQM